MCYSQRSSLISYTLGLFAAAFCFKTRQMILGCLILCYTQIQLGEFMIWRSLDSDNERLNRMGTNFAKYLLPAHNIAIGVGVLLSIALIQKRRPRPSDFVPLCLGLVFFFSVLWFVYHGDEHAAITKPLADTDCNHDRCRTSNNRLQWPFRHGWYTASFALSIIILMIYIKPRRTKIFLFCVFTMTFLCASLLTKQETISSAWCFIAAIAAPLIAFIGWLLIRNTPNRLIQT